MFRVLVIVALVCAVHPSLGMSGNNCWGPKAVGFDSFPEEAPKYLNGQPGSNTWYETPINFTVAFIGDQGKDEPAFEVLRLIKREGTDMVIHAGDFDYINNPDLWDSIITNELGADFPYFSLLGNHDCYHWDNRSATDEGYQQKIYNRMKRIGADLYCVGEVGLNQVCAYKGIVFVLTSPGAAKPQCREYCERCPVSIGQTVFIDRAFKTFPGRWRVCAWHKNHRLMQVGGKNTEVGLPLYDMCRTHGAVIHTGHEHSYSRTHLMTDFVSQKYSTATPNHIILQENQTVAWVSGIAGIPLRPFMNGLENNPWWASRLATNNGLSHGAVICRYNYNGNPRLAFCETKAINGTVMDHFMLESNFPAPPVDGKVCEKKADIEVQVAQRSDNVVQNYWTECPGDNLQMSAATTVALRFTGVKAAQGARVTSAILEFGSDNENLGSFSVRIQGEAANTSLPWTCDANLASRNRTQASVIWESWEEWHEGGLYKSTNIAPIIQEILDLPGWQESGAITLFINGITGQRDADSFDGDKCSAPTLHITFEGSSGLMDCVQHTPPPGAPAGEPPSASTLTPAERIPPSSEIPAVTPAAEIPYEVPSHAPATQTVNDVPSSWRLITIGLGASLVVVLLVAALIAYFVTRKTQASASPDAQELIGADSEDDYFIDEDE